MGAVPRLAIPLEGELVRLEPIEAGHAEELWRAAQAPEIWRWLVDVSADRGLFEQWLEQSVTATEEDREGVFATRELRGGSVVGSTRFLNVRRPDRVVEIGWTWLNPSAWRSGANLEAKLLMMGHAFDALECQRVELKTDARNELSRRAMEAIPAQFEGIMRKHMTMPGIGVRDSAYYSVIDDEWPAVRANLERRLGRAT
jgi:RimJ/RimL family protein N-acetyltransferase